MVSLAQDLLDGPFPELAIKAPVRVATTAQVALFGLQVVDGQQLAEGDRVLVRAQADQKDNGIRIASASVWRRAADCDGARDLTNGTTIEVQQGAVFGGLKFVFRGGRAPVIGTDALTFVTEDVFGEGQLETYADTLTRAVRVQPGDQEVTLEPQAQRAGKFLFTRNDGTIGGAVGSDLMPLVDQAALDILQTAFISRGIRNFRTDFGASGSGDPASDDTAALRAAINSGYYVEVGETTNGYNFKQPTSGVLCDDLGGGKIIGIGLPRFKCLNKTSGTPGARPPFTGTIIRWLGKGSIFENIAFDLTHQTQAYQFRIGVLGDTGQAAFNRIGNLHFFNGNSGIYCYGNRNDIHDLFGYEMRGSMLNFDDTAEYNRLRGVRLRNCSGGIGIKGRANNNLLQDMKKWVEKDKYALVAYGVLGDFAIDQIGAIDAIYRQRARDGFYGGDICSHTANTFRNRCENIEASGLRDGGFTLNGYHNVLDGGYIHDSAASASAIVGENCFYMNVEIDNCKAGIQPRASFGGLSRNNYIINCVVTNCFEQGLFQVGENANRVWAPLQTYNDDPDYITYNNGVTNVIYNAYAPGGTTTTGSVPPTHTTPDVPVWDATEAERDPPAVAVTINLTTSVFSRSAHGLTANRPVVFQPGSTLPAPLVAGKTYFVVSPTTNTFRLALDTKTYDPVEIAAGATQAGTHTYKAPRGTQWIFRNAIPASETFTPRDNYVLGGLFQKNAGGDIVKASDGAIHLIGVAGANGLLSEGDPGTLRDSTNTIKLKGTSLDAGSVELSFDGLSPAYACGTTASSDGIVYTASSGGLLPARVPGLADQNPMITVTFNTTNTAGKRAAWDYPGYDPNVYDDFDSIPLPTLNVDGQGPLLIRQGNGMPYDLNAITAGVAMRFVRRTGLIAKAVSHRTTIRDGWYNIASDEPTRNALALFSGKTSFFVTGRITAKRAVHDASPTVNSVFTTKSWEVIFEVRRLQASVLTSINAASVVKTVKYQSDAAAAAWDIAIGSIATSTPRVTRPTIICTGAGAGAIEWSAELQVD